MTTDTGRSPSGRAAHERSHSSVSPPSVGVPNAAGPFSWQLREFAGEIADAVPDAAHLCNCAADVEDQMVGLLVRARKNLAPAVCPDDRLCLAVLCDDIDELLRRPGWPTASAMSAGTAATTQIDAGLQPASAVPKADAQGPSQ